MERSASPDGVRVPGHAPRDATGDGQDRHGHAFAETLHDNVGQPLAVARMFLQQVISPDCDHQEGDLALVLELIDLAIHETRAIIVEASPIMLAKVGFHDTVKAFCDDVGRTYGLRVTTAMEGSADALLTEEQAKVLFRSVRELVMNTVKYASASTLTVRSMLGDGCLLVTVEDDGVGFDVGECTDGSPLSFGLASMRQQMAGLGGDVTFDSQPGAGARAMLRLPIEAPVAR